MRKVTTQARRVSLGAHCSVCFPPELEREINYDSHNSYLRLHITRRQRLQVRSLIFLYFVYSKNVSSTTTTAKPRGCDISWINLQPKVFPNAMTKCNHSPSELPCSNTLTPIMITNPNKLRPPTLPPSSLSFTTPPEQSNHGFSSPQLALWPHPPKDLRIRYIAPTNLGHRNQNF